MRVEELAARFRKLFWGSGFASPLVAQPDRRLKRLPCGKNGTRLVPGVSESPLSKGLGTASGVEGLVLVVLESAELRPRFEPRFTVEGMRFELRSSGNFGNLLNARNPKP